MGIPVLQQEAFSKVTTFIDQVNACVAEQALIKSDNGGAPDALSLDQRNSLAAIIRNPGSFGFAKTIVADAGWGLEFDPWAANPQGGAGAILSGVQKYFNLMTGYNPTPPAPEGLVVPEAEPPP